MIYTISDIHGCYDKYQELLRTIHFSPDDTLYVLGDVIDRGPDGFKTLLDMGVWTRWRKFILEKETCPTYCEYSY